MTAVKFLAVKSFLRESLELLYCALFLPSRLQQRMNAWLPSIQARAHQEKPRDTTPYEMLTRRHIPQAQRFLAQCALWWILGLGPMWLLGWGKLPLWLLLSLSVLLPWLAWGIAMIDIPSGLLAPLWIGLMWVWSPARMETMNTTWQAVGSTLSAALKPWWVWETVGLVIGGALGSGLLCGGLERWLVATHRQREAIGWSAVGALLLYLIFLTMVAVGLPGMQVDALMTAGGPSISLGRALATGVGLGMLGGILGAVGGPLAGGMVQQLAPGLRHLDDATFNVAGDVAIGVAAGVAVGMAGVVAFGVAFNVLFGAEVGVAAGVAGVIAFGMAFGMAVSGTVSTTDVAGIGMVVGMAFSIASVVAGVVAGVVAFGAVGSVAFFVAFVVAGGTAFLVILISEISAIFFVAGAVAAIAAGGMTGGLLPALLGLAALPPGPVWGLLMLAFWGLSVRHNLRWLVLTGTGLGALIGIVQGWDTAVLAVLPILAGGLRLGSTLAAAVAGLIAWTAPPYWKGNEGKKYNTLRWLRMVPPFSDEIVWTPVPFLDRLLVRAYEEDAVAGLDAIRVVNQSFHQRWAAHRALVIITRQTLQGCEDLDAIAQVGDCITWLPENLSALGPDINELVPRFLRTARSVAVALESNSTYNRRQGLRAAAEDVHLLEQNLALWGGKRARARWQPVVDAWQRVLTAELERPVTVAETGALPNPYRVGTPLLREHRALFRGREALRDAVAGALLGQERVTLVLYGPRRMGKTSFLQQLPNLLTGDVLPVFVDLQRPATTRNTAAFFYSLTRAITQEARVYLVTVPTMERAAFWDDDPFLVFEDWLDTALNHLQGWRLLLMMDEFEKLSEAVASGMVEEAVLDELRHVIQHKQQLTLLFAGIATLEELGPRWSSYFINTRALEITYLLPDEAESLIRTPNPEIDFPLSYDDEVVRDILALTRCQPALVQLLCSEIVNEANARKTLQATPAVLKAAIIRALTGGGPFYFRNIWDEMTGTNAASIAAGQAVLRKLARVKGSVPLDLTTADVATRRAVDRMLRLHVIEQAAGGYCIEVPLVKRWVVEYAPSV
jgi:hypothetical protein